MIQFSPVWLFATPWTAACRASLSSPTPGAYSKSCPLSQWCHPTISSFVFPFSSCLQSFPWSGSFPMSQFFTSGGQSIWVSASASVNPMNIQEWFPLGWAGWISLQSKRLSRIFSNTTFHQQLKLTFSFAFSFLLFYAMFTPRLTPGHSAFYIYIYLFLAVLGLSCATDFPLVGATL